MELLKHPLLEQTGEYNNLSGGLFAPVYQLHGQFTRTGLRDLLRDELIQPAIADIQAGRTRAFFVELDPDEVLIEERCEEAIAAECIKVQFGFRNSNIFDYLDHRDDPRYQGACIHAHVLSRATSSVVYESGTLPTTWFMDNDEVEAAVRDGVSRIGGAVEADFSQEMTQMVQSPLIGDHSADAANSLKEMHSARKKDTLPGVVEVLQHVHDTTADKIEIAPQLGRISIFGPTVVHSSNPFAYPNQEQPGDLVVDLW